MSTDASQNYIDLKALKINCANKDDLVLRLLKLFIQQGSHWSADLTESFSQGDEQGVREICHRIKGGSATVQAYQVTEAAITLGDYVKQGKIDSSEGKQAYMDLLSTIKKSMDFAVTIDESRI